MSASVFSQRARGDQVTVQDYRAKADGALLHAQTLTFMADEAVGASVNLHDSDPARRAGLATAQAYRAAANAWTDAAEMWQSWAADLDAHLRLVQS